MDKQTRNQIKTSVQEALREVESDIQNLELLTKPISPDNAIGRITRMDAINNKSINEANLNNARRKKQQLSEILSGIDNENFGLCVICRQRIPVERLLLLPESNRCVKCA